MPRKDAEEKRTYDKERYMRNRSQIAVKMKAYRDAHKDDPAYRLRARNWTRAAMWKLKGRPAPTRPEVTHCEICGRPPGKHRLALDHNHASGKFRGWLCHNCNVSLGLFADNPVWLERAAAYVRRDGEEEWLCVS